MTARQRLIPDREIKRVLSLLKEQGVDVGACTIDIRVDGVTVSPPVESQGASAYDRWKAKDAGRDQAPHRH